MMLFIVVLLLSGCSPSEDKQAKEILADYFLQREAKLYIDDYQKTGVVETKSIENKELIIVNDGDTKNKLYLFEPTTEKKTRTKTLTQHHAITIFRIARGSARRRSP